MNNADTPATGIKYTLGKGNYSEDYIYLGLTKREAFAMAAMQGLLAKFVGQVVSGEDIAICSVEQADALLKQLEVK